MAVKRRTIWMSDEDWAKLDELAAERKVSNSAYIRAVTVGGGFLTPRVLLAEMARVDAMPMPYRGSFNSQPFTGPIPKKGK